MAEWLFQGNSKTTYRLLDALNEVHEHGSQMVWQAKQHWREIQLAIAPIFGFQGQRVVSWVARRSRANPISFRMIHGS